MRIYRTQLICFLEVLTLVCSIDGLTIVGTVEEDVTFYHKQLSTTPSTLATIEYHVTYNHSHVAHNTVMHIYTTEDHPSFHTNCTTVRKGQILNENLSAFFTSWYVQRNNLCTPER